MRLFQISGMYNAYLKDFEKRYPESRHSNFSKRLQLITADRFGASHLLKPMLESDPDAFLTWANDKKLQSAWAEEQGLKTKDPEKILLAQIEAHRTEVLYVLPCIQYDSLFIKKLPGCVKKTLSWCASSLGNADLSAYDLVLTNFPIFIETWSAMGLRASWFMPSHDPVMVNYANNDNRPIDIVFVGSYSRHHRRRAKILHALSTLSAKYRIEMYLSKNYFQTLNILNFFPVPLPLRLLPKNLDSITMPPVFGLEMYSVLSKSKIVLNIHIDMAEKYRGNMRCFEALGCGGCLLTDEGVYPSGLSPEKDFAVYQNEHDCIKIIEHLLNEHNERKKIAQRGTVTLVTKFSKDQQWLLFKKLAGIA